MREGGNPREGGREPEGSREPASVTYTTMRKFMHVLTRTSPCFHISGGSTVQAVCALPPRQPTIPHIRGWGRQANTA